MATVRPLGDRVLVKLVSRERVSSGGVVLPDTVREQSDRGYVIAVGPGTPEMEPLFTTGGDVNGASVGVAGYRSGHRRVAVEVGEVVLFSPYAGSKVSQDDDDFLLLRERDILGVVEGVEVVEDDKGAIFVRDLVAV